ncbi:lysozyme precursor-like protein [Leptotrombidium deliense]|uniref:lysozyme n=1 Tax=Leptotrombidium deliense TaxID=299467 RepID=A0A443SH48_9ACAR|nr:lysozyme precursor-like protein [Leptotrombidium deliense]
MIISKAFVIWFLILCSHNFVNISFAKIYDRCDLANLLLNKYKFPKDDIADWICLIFAESTFNGSAVGNTNKDGSLDYGLFQPKQNQINKQVSDRYWCSPPAKANECKMECDDLLDDNLDDDITCVKKIYKIHGFRAWTGWYAKCRNHDVQQYIKDCKLERSVTSAASSPIVDRKKDWLPNFTFYKPLKSKIPLNRVYIFRYE